MIKTAVIVLLASCLLATLPTSSSFSQGPEMKRGPAMGMRPWRPGGPCYSSSELNLSQEQSRGLEQIQQTYFQEAQLIRAQLFAKRLELREFLVNPTLKIESIRAKHQEIIDLQSKQEEKAIEYLIKVRKLLTLEQIQNWCPEQEFPSLRQMRYGPSPMGPKRFREE
ncbi:MAG: periplasmic heavy metal sensor [Syntrophaceae bacterium]|nr:periplasmic heavy metal sensor [Syntrophaceae bacterium]